eukprot:UN32255
MSKRKQEVGEVLKKLETNDKYMCNLWDKTKVWSLDAFRDIYKWLGCRFDVEFFESQCSEPSLELVERYLKKGVFVKSEGAVGCRLDKNGFCMLLKSNGSGLYATKDLALAEKKFNEFKVDRSLYVVDASQSLHFKQVFGTLDKMGFKQSEKCIHLPYAMVVLPDGKMSSRAGNVILFDDLKKQLAETLDENIIKNLTFDEATKNEIRKACSVGSIRYGMLDHDVQKDITFDIKQWTKLDGGNTGPYMMYQCARVKSIVRKVEPDPKAKVNLSLLTDESSQQLLLELSQFQSVVKRTLECSHSKMPNPSTLCTYSFD